MSNDSIRLSAPGRLPIDHGGPVNRPFESFPYSALEGTIIERFETVAARHFDRQAVSDSVRRVAYGELAGLVNRIASAIAEVVAERPGPVAILLPSDVRFPAAMLGVLAAGRGCVPLDVGNPAERNGLIAMQSGAAAVVSTGEFAARARTLFPQSLPVVDIETIDDAASPRPITRSRPRDLAFIVYTSGSSGRPKGAYHNHRNILHDVMQQTETLHLNHEDRVALLYSPSVYAAVRQILIALLNGASLHILPPQELQGCGLVREIRARGITICEMVPVLLRRIAGVLVPDRRLDSVRVVGLAAQRIDWIDFDVFRRHFSSEAFLIVGLGSTESGGRFCHWFVDERVRAQSSRLPIGRILPDATVTIADSDGRPLADGEIGEFVVASRYVALGYWRDPDLTASAFTTDPADPEIRIFKTGDMGRMRPDGLLEFIGRNDQQIKLRGHRIEIGEIEFALGGLAGVEDAAVVVRRNDAGLPRSLAAYVEPRPGVQGLLPRDLLSMLMEHLPRYMIPGTLHVVDELPRFPNLKTDRAQLARIDAARAARMANPDDDPVISEVAAIFESVLGCADATSEDNVSSLGGDSLQAVKLALELENRFQISIPPEIFDATQTIGDLARWIASETALGRRPHPKLG